MMLEQIVASRIKEARKSAGLTLEALGVKIGIDEATARVRMSQYENAVHTPPLSTIERIALALGKPALWFLCEEEDKAIVLVWAGMSSAEKEKMTANIENRPKAGEAAP
jgi:transcriptional regulator with XRE-family HTH domain